MLSFRMMYRRYFERDGKHLANFFLFLVGEHLGVHKVIPELDPLSRKHLAHLSVGPLFAVRGNVHPDPIDGQCREQRHGHHEPVKLCARDRPPDTLGRGPDMPFENQRLHSTTQGLEEPCRGQRLQQDQLLQPARVGLQPGRVAAEVDVFELEPRQLRAELQEVG